MLSEVSDIGTIVQLPPVAQQNVQTLVCLNYNKYFFVHEILSTADPKSCAV